MAITAQAASRVGPEGVPGDVLHDPGERRLRALELLPGAGADGDEGDEHVERGDDHQGEHDRAGQVALGVLRLFAGGGGRVEADVGEEQRGGGRPLTPAVPSGMKGVKLPDLKPMKPIDAEQHQGGDLHADHDRVDAGGLAGAAEQQAHREDHDDQGRQVEYPAVAGRRGQRVGDGHADRAVEEFVEVLPPADGDRRHGDAVLQDQAPAADPGDAVRRALRKRRSTRSPRRGWSPPARRRKARRRAR